MYTGIPKGLQDIVAELKGIKHILASMWHSRYQEGETDQLNPEAYTDEYISTEECGRRLGISDQTVRNWISIGKNNPSKGWVEGLHYVNASPNPGKKALLRIPWNTLVRSFAKNKKIDQADLRDNLPSMYCTTTAEKVMGNGTPL